MIDQIEFQNFQGASLPLQFDNVNSGITVKEIEGLGPVKATIVSSSFANRDGTQYQSSRRDARNPVFKFRLEASAGQTIRQIRSQMYDFFMPKLELRVKITLADGLVVNLVGRVESCEPDIFTNEPGMIVSMVCFDPDFINPNAIVISGSTTELETEQTINYLGTVETGIQLALMVDRYVGNFTIYHKPPDGSIRSLDFTLPLLAGDVLTISTISGEKGITRNRDGVVTSVLYGMPAQSNWIELFRGVNKIRVYAEGAPIPYTIAYTERYGGL